MVQFAGEGSGTAGEWVLQSLDSLLPVTRSLMLLNHYWLRPGRCICVAHGYALDHWSQASGVDVRVHHSRKGGL